MELINNDKFKCFVRYMINVAKQKRCVPYYELENIFGLSHKQVGLYAGALGDFCFDQGYPLLNGLIISHTNCIPSHGFNWYLKKSGRPWGELVQECWKRFHVKSTRQKQIQDFSGLDEEIEEFLEE